MYSIPDAHLRVSAIVRHWHRQIAGTPSEDEVLGTFLRAFWMANELFSRAVVRPDYRLHWLYRFHYWNRNEDLCVPNFHIFFGQSPIKESQDSFTLMRKLAHTRPEPAAIREWDLEKVVYLGFGHWESSEQWTPKEIAAACEHLADSRPDQMPHYFIEELQGLRIGRDDFKAWCRRNHWPLPPFWFSCGSPHPSAPTTAKAVSECQAWLAGEVDKAQRGPKAVYLAEATARFPKLSQQAFNMVWKDVASPAWRRAGRRPSGSASQSN